VIVSASYPSDKPALTYDVNAILQQIYKDINTGFMFEEYVNGSGRQAVKPPPQLQIIPATEGCQEGTVLSPDNGGCCAFLKNSMLIFEIANFFLFLVSLLIHWSVGIHCNK
jgi:hypothetical protein